MELLGHDSVRVVRESNMVVWMSLAAASPVESEVTRLVTAAEGRDLLDHLDRTAQALGERLTNVDSAAVGRLAETLSALVAENLAEKRAAGVRYDGVEVRRKAIEYEAFKLETYVKSGVFPKRYFGYFDERGDTEPHERRLRAAVHCATDAVNAWEVQHGSPIRVTEAEIAVTYVAEGGALHLREQQDRLEHLHPVFDVGLDDFALGSSDLEDLRDRIDASCRTDLGGLVKLTPAGSSPPDGALGRLNAPAGQWAWLVRYATFEEGIAGTAMMWAWEKDIAAHKLGSQGREPLHTRDAREQFIIGSLVYNSGIEHSESTIQAIKGFSANAYVVERARGNPNKGILNVAPSSVLLQEVVDRGAYREQWTSWNAAYHILQRYGAYEALGRFTDTFDEGGRFR